MPSNPRFALATIVLLAASLAGACGDPAPTKSKNGDPVVIKTGESDAGSDVGAVDGGSDIPLPDDIEDPEGPTFLELSVAPARLTQGEAVTVDVLVTDPDGFADIGGGRIIDADGNVYGAFAGSGGTYTAALTWEAIQNVAPSTFETSESHVFLAEFFDAANHRSTRAFSVELHCDGRPACEGICGDTLCTDACAAAGLSCTPGQCVSSAQLEFDPENCGACGNACAEGESCNGTCECQMDSCGSACVDLGSDTDHCGQCGNSCGTGQICDQGDCLEASLPFSSCDTTECVGPATCVESEAGYFCGYVCLEDSECPSNWPCQVIPQYNLGFCYIPCTTNAECSGGQVCGNLRDVSADLPDVDLCLPPM